MSLKEGQALFKSIQQLVTTRQSHQAQTPALSPSLSQELQEVQMVRIGKVDSSSKYAFSLLIPPFLKAPGQGHMKYATDIRFQTTYPHTKVQVLEACHSKE